MKSGRAARIVVLAALTGALAGCGGIGSGNFFSRGSNQTSQAAQPARERVDATERQSTIWDLFTNRDDPNTTVEVNKYIWQASLEVLNFLPMEVVDPFSGVIVTGYASPPGGGPAYRATVYVQDPALDARALKLSLMTRSGPASPDTVRAVEDAILTRARMIRVRDSRL